MIYAKINLLVILLLAFVLTAFASCGESEQDGSYTNDEKPGGALNTEDTDVVPPEVWLATLHPTLRKNAEQKEEYLEFLTDMSNWQWVAENIDGIILLGDMLTLADAPVMTDAHLDALCDILKATNTKLAMEMAFLFYFDPEGWGADFDPTSDMAAKILFDWSMGNALIPEFLKRGIKVDMFKIEGAITRANDIYAQFNNGVAYNSWVDKMSYDDACALLTKVINLFKEVLPEAEFVYCFNIPNFGYKGGWSPNQGYYGGDDRRQGMGDFYEIFNKMIENYVPIDGIIIDMPYEYKNIRTPNDANGAIWETTWIPEGKTTGDLLDRMKDFEDIVKSTTSEKGKNLTYGVYFNTMREVSEDDYSWQTLTFIKDYIDNYGGNPDMYNHYSWVETQPAYALPETRAHTNAWLASEIIKYVKFGAALTIPGDAAGWAARASHTVVFDSAGGTPVPSSSVYVNTPLNSSGTYPKPAAPTREGYAFLGWFAKGSGEEFDFDTPIAAAVKLTAKWE